LRHLALLCLCHEQLVTLVDEVLDRVDQAIGEADGRTAASPSTFRPKRRPPANEKAALFDLLVGLLLDDWIADDELRQVRMAGHTDRPLRRPRADTRARSCVRSTIATSSSSRSGLRTCGASPLRCSERRASMASRQRVTLLDAIELRRGLIATGRRALPDAAATGLAPARWRAPFVDRDGWLDR
jgi:hypothetical protein